MQEFLGFDQESLFYNKSYTISREPPGMSVVKDAIVSPFHPTVSGNFLEELGGGAYDHDGHLLEACLQPRSDGRNAVLANQAISPPKTQGRLQRAVFGGFAFDHFGHFLLETTARLWCLPEYRDLPWLFLTDGKPMLRRYQAGFLEILGLSSEQIVPISSLHHVDELIIPEPSFVYHHHVTHAYRDTFRRARLSPSNRPGRRIFLSRSNTTIARTIGERELEMVLAADGWDIVIPELLQPVEQAGLFQDDNIIMGLQGSAMHLGLFAPPGRRTVHLCRGAAYRGYYILDELMQADASYLVAMSEHPLKSKPIHGPFLLDFEKTILFLRQKKLLAGSGVGVVLPKQISNTQMDGDYRAWWHYTESQSRFHRQIADDGSKVSQDEALAPALEAVKLRRADPEILAHAVALTLKLQGFDAASSLLDQFEGWSDLTNPSATAHLFHFRSIICDARTDYDGALDTATRALELAPADPTYVNQLATVLFRLRRLEEAEIMLRAVVEKGTAIAGTYFLLSIIRLDLGDVEDGIFLARRATQMDGQELGICRHFAATLLAQGRSREALQAYLAFLERNSSVEASFLIEVAQLEQDLGESESALQRRLAAYRLDLDDAVIKELVVTDLTLAGRFPDLSALLTQVPPAVQEHSAMIYRRSLALAVQDKFEESLQVAVVAVELDPANTVIMQNLLGLMIRTKRLHEARLLGNLLIEKDLATGGTFYALSLIESDLGRFAAAREAAGLAADLEPTNDLITDHYRRLVEGG